MSETLYYSPNGGCLVYSKISKITIWHAIERSKWWSSNLSKDQQTTIKMLCESQQHCVIPSKHEEWYLALKKSLKPHAYYLSPMKVAS